MSLLHCIPPGNHKGEPKDNENVFTTFALFMIDYSINAIILFKTSSSGKERKKKEKKQNRLFNELLYLYFAYITYPVPVTSRYYIQVRQYENNILYAFQANKRKINSQVN